MTKSKTEISYRLSDEPSQLAINSFWSASPLNEAWFITELTEVDVKEENKQRRIETIEELKKHGRSKGFIRIKSLAGEEALYFLDCKTNVLRLIDMNEAELTQLKQLTSSINVLSQTTTLLPPAILTAISNINAIHQFILHSAELPSTEAQIQSLGTVTKPPSHLLQFQIAPLLKTNPALFHYMTSSEQDALAIQLRTAYHYLCTAYRSEDILTQQYRLKRLKLNIERCAYLLQCLAYEKKTQQLIAQLKQDEHDATQSKKTRHQIQSAITDTLTDFSSGKTVHIRNWMASFKEWLTYLGWTKDTIKLATSLIPGDFYNVQQTIDATKQPQETLQHLACLLHYSRFLMTFILVCKHSINPLMSAEEKSLVDKTGGRWRNFVNQLAAEKFMLLNDLIKGTNNLLAILIFIKPALGPIGDLLTTFVIVGDLGLNQWATREAEKQHQEELAFYDNEIQLLRKQNDEYEQRRITLIASRDFYIRKSKDAQMIEASEREDAKNRAQKDEEAILALAEAEGVRIAQLKKMEKAKQACEAQWLLNKHNYQIDQYYIIASLIVYPIIVFPWAAVGVVAPASAILMSSTLIGFCISCAYTSYRIINDCSQSITSRQTALEACFRILDNEEISEADYIRYQDLRAQADYQKELSQYQAMVLLRSIMVQAIIPIAILVGFTFATFWFGAAAFAVVAVVAIASHFIIEYFKPMEAALSEFKEADYNTFKTNQLKIKQETEKEIAHIGSKGLLSLFSNHQSEAISQETIISPTIAHKTE